MTVNEYFEANYNELISYCNKMLIPQDNLNEVYLKVRENIKTTGMTSTEFGYYVKRSLYNLMLDDKKSLRYRTNTIEFNNDNDFIEKILREQDDSHNDDLMYREQVEWLTKRLFDFISERNYSEYEVFIFKSYFLVPKMTYQKLKSNLGIDIMIISQIIRKFKKDIKNNFINYLNRMSIEEVKTIMQLPMRAALTNKYKQIYKIATGSDWTACLCGTGARRLYVTCLNFSKDEEKLNRLLKK